MISIRDNDIENNRAPFFFSKIFTGQVVITDKYPVALHYVAHLDQVWVLNWRSVYDDGVKTIQVIRDASQKRKHHTVHPEPIDGQFDLVRDLFMPTAQVLYRYHARACNVYTSILTSPRSLRT